MEEKALDFRPRLVICGGSAYPRDWDYARIRAIADKVGAWMLCDMAHISDLVAAQEAGNSFEYCDVVTTTTHKSLRGPRAGMIFYRKGPKPATKKGQPEENYDLEDKINFAVFPSLQKRPHNHQIAALAVALKQVNAPEFKAYAKQIRANAVALGDALMRKGYKLVTTVPRTTGALGLASPRPHWQQSREGVRLGSHYSGQERGQCSGSWRRSCRVGPPAMTSRGLKEDLEKIADLLSQAVNITLSIQEQHGKLLQDGLVDNKEMEYLKAEVEQFATSFDMPGFDVSAMKYHK